MKKLSVITILTFAILLFGCNDEGSTPTIRFNFNTVTTASNIPIGGRVEANSLQFDSGTITLTQIQFETETDNGDSVEVDMEQVVEIDFATGETTPDLSSLNFPVGTFVETRVELELLDENNMPSVIIEGTFTDSNDQTHPIQFEFNSGETFEVEKEGTITIAEGTNVIAQVTFDPGVWFTGVTSTMLEGATKDNNGVIVISETSNSNIFDIVADGLDLATEVEIEF